MEKPHKNNDAILLRLPKELKEELQRQADINDRRITAEINTRLRVSLAATGPTLQAHLAREAFGGSDAAAPGIAPSAPITPPATGPNAQGVTLSDIDMAMLRVFHGMSVEKQLALLSLFK